MEAKWGAHTIHVLVLYKYFISTGTKTEVQYFNRWREGQKDRQQETVEGKQREKGGKKGESTHMFWWRMQNKPQNYKMVIHPNGATKAD